MKKFFAIFSLLAVSSLAFGEEEEACWTVSVDGNTAIPCLRALPEKTKATCGTNAWGTKEQARKKLKTKVPFGTLDDCIIS